jgi:hypothetical protein
VKLAALLSLLVVACSTTTVITRTERRVRIVVVPCLSQKPPTAPVLSGDDTIDRGRKLDAYERLERYVRLVVVPGCLE